MREPNFFMVWNPEGHAPTFQHLDVEDAKNEAMRLARNNPGQRFVVLCSIGQAVLKDPVDWEPHDNIPF